MVFKDKMLIKNFKYFFPHRCPKDNVRLLSTNVSSDVRFSFKAFDFRHNSSGFIYIHCEVAVCGADDIACRMECASRGKRSVSSRQGSHLVSTGPLLVERRDANTRGRMVL